MLLNAPSSFKRPDGKWEHHIRQSDLVTFAQCPELHRRQLLGITIGDEGDSAILGSACHEAYAVTTRMIMQGFEPEFEWVRGIALDNLAHLWMSASESNTLRQVQLASIEEAGLDAHKCVTLWYENYYPWLVTNSDLIESVEQSFDIKAYEDSARIIYLTGTWDLAYADQLFDYKHSTSQKYTKQKAWQLSRYHPQPTHYVWAADMLGYLVDPETYLPTLEADNDEELRSFTFININPEKYYVDNIGPDEGVKLRTVGDCKFHLELMKSLAYLIEAELPSWPLGPNDWWCSSKWCPAWSDCRGKFIGEDPWRLLEKATAELDKRR